MPKKKRKGRSPRRRPNAGRSHLTLAPPPPPEPTVPAPVDLPRGAREPLLRLEFSPEATPADVERAIRYWTPNPEGGWTEPVSVLGVPSKVAAELREVCEAYLPHHLCGTCASPFRVTTRSDAATRAGSDLQQRKNVTFTCPACRAAADRIRAEEARAAQEQAKAAQQAQRAAAEAFFEEQETAATTLCRHTRRTTEMTPEMACVLAAMIDHSRARRILPPRSRIPLGWVYAATDDDVLGQLYGAGWIRIDPSAPDEALSFDEQGKLDGFYLALAPFRLVSSVAATREDLWAMLLAHSKDTHLRHIQHQVRLMEADSLFRYLDNLLVERYQYPPVPENKVSDLYQLLFAGLEDYTFGQMVCFLWRAADTSAAWKERKQLADAHASSATVTVLENKLNTARECKMPIPGYDPPRSHNDPPALAASRALLREFPERTEQLQQCELHEDQTLPCSNCLGMLYEGGQNADEIREHYLQLGEAAVELRPDLATKTQTHLTTH
ncbi:hypothetical protein [Nocardiopsis sp. L17-MgMaSL7]|uniref:hypothetical protein n=1 Tax=Nocardiopsis sp. L17-MgMaSL7 TaxID=1938893 RepID=UPI000D999433|nr:hypothetical protein [Nocardiopsis sp. L17-MgMaSL7]PWV44614.1 hypothetical protein BDW27_12373 [Nocardiopsis sp. L17-MgMaSL7]